MSLNIAELLNPSPPSPAPPPLPSSEKTSSFSANTNTQASTTQTSSSDRDPSSQPPDDRPTSAMDGRNDPVLPVAAALPGQGDEKRSAWTPLQNLVPYSPTFDPVYNPLLFQSRKPTTPPQPNTQSPNHASAPDHSYGGPPLEIQPHDPLWLTQGRKPTPPIKRGITKKATKRSNTGNLPGAQAAALPVEPSAPTSNTPTSPSLDQYHLSSGPSGSKSRANSTSDNLVLAPIHLSAPLATAYTLTTGHELEDAEQYGNNGHKGVFEPSSPAGDAHNEIAESGNEHLSTATDVNLEQATKAEHELKPPTQAHPEQALAVEMESQAPHLESLSLVQTEESINTTTEAVPPTSIPTSKKVVAMKRGLSRASSADVPSPRRSMSIGKETPLVPTAGMKRKEPASGRKIEKKGIAKPAPAKKRKIYDDTASSARRTGSPASSRASKTSALKSTTKATQAASVPSSPPVEDEDERMEDDDSIDETQLFCTCRKPDDHSYMIACDGCDDWFHGKCVGIKESEGESIDRYFCENCDEMNRGETSYKALCRLSGCPKPARLLLKGGPSKYCSDDHGLEFMRQKLNSSLGDNNNEDEEPSRGGVLTAGELKAVVNSVKSPEEFRKLGEGVLPRAPPNDNTFEIGVNGTGTTSSASIKDDDIIFSESELSTLKEIERKRKELSENRKRLQDKEKFVSAVRLRGKAALEFLKAKDKSIKDICGWDSRVSWSDDHYDTFRSRPESDQVLRGAEPLGGPATTKWVETGVDAMDVDQALENPHTAQGTNSTGDATPTDPETDGLCLNKRCSRHSSWRNIFLDSFRAELRELSVQEAGMDREAKGVKDRAILRMIEVEN